VITLRGALRLGVLLLAASCTQPQLLDPTQTVVVVDAEPGVRARADALVVSIHGDDGKRLRADTRRRSDGTLAWPYLVALSPKNGDASRGFEVVADARDGRGSFLAKARVISGYVNHEQRTVTLMLEDSCIGVDTCRDDQTCRKGKCVSAEVSVEDLSSFDEAKLPKPVTVKGDAAVSDDAGHDASVDAGGDAAMDAGEDSSVDAGGDGGGGDSGLCRPNPTDDVCPEICPEICNDKDDDCDRKIDESDAIDDSCDGPQSEGACVNGKCVITDCTDDYRDCDEKPSNGCEAGPNDENNCGKCGQVCAYDNAEVVCLQGLCIQIGCAAAHGDCDDDRKACETELTSLEDCGRCGQDCEDLERATPTCATGKCAVASCDFGYGDCNEAGSDGCEVSLNSPLHCGACNTPCDFPGSATDSCATGTCVAGACEGGYADCDGDPTDGCEDLSGNQNCGGCGQKCNAALMNVESASCASGVCDIAVCDSGFGDCDPSRFNGCETSLKTLSNCGDCGEACVIDNAEVSCDTGACTFVRCQDGWGNCDNSLDNSCEQNLSDPSTCGSCATDCADQVGKPYCSGGLCTSAVCTQGMADCDQAGGTCETTLSSDVLNCGGCGNACAFSVGAPHASSLTCQLGACKPVCDTGYGDCNGNYADGCEVDLRTLDNCGSCDMGCAIPNATATCATGQCVVDTCGTGLGNCDGNATDCETSLSTTSNCGACGAACNLPQAVESCGGTPGARVCEVAACESGFGNCDDSSVNGCEVNFDTPQNCGGCASKGQNTPCTNLPNATATTCDDALCTVTTCTADWADCDGVAANGCEQQISVVGPCFPDTGCTKVEQSGRNYFFCSTSRTWTDARSKCQLQLLGDLVRIDDLDENSFITGNVLGDTWIGAHDRDTEGAWEWADNEALFWAGAAGGATVGGAYVKWGGGEPNDGSSNEDCGQISAGNWTDKPCTQTRPFVCEVQADLCPDDPNKKAPGQCGCGSADTDGDGDGTANCNDGCPSDPGKTAPGVCGCGVGDTDGDGTEDCSETCDSDPLKLSPGLCGCGTPDTNSDGDSLPDCNETCDNDPNKTAPGACGCGLADTNSDGDSQADCNETCDSDPNKTAPGVCGCGTPDTDSDGDGTLNCNDLCPNNNPKTAPGVCGCAVADTNTDGDSQADCNETCDNDPNKLAPGTCGCGNGDAAGYVSCNGADGVCETAISTLSNCGSCGNVCNLANASEACTGSGHSYACTIASCDASYYSNCNSVTADGCEIDTRTNTANCGACGNSCASHSNVSSASCSASACGYTCDSGYGDCNATAGCETNTRTLSNCGGCGVPCSRSNATATCATGTCAISACTGGYSNCDGVDANGCEPLTTLANCGGCNVPCSVQNGTASCSTGTCAKVSCNSGYADCNGDLTCERDTNALGPCVPDTGCTAHVSGDATYYVCPTARTWADARSKCQLQTGGDLAHVSDLADNAFIQSKLSVNAWLGAYDGAVEGAWRWTDDNTQFWQGTSTGSAVNAAFTNWNSGEPNDASSNEDCAEMVVATGKWNDNNCTLAKPFVCEVKADQCPSDPDKSLPGQCGCGVVDTDADSDGTADCNETCDNDPNKLAPGACGCGTADTDSDGDGTVNCSDACPNDPLKTAVGMCGCGIADTDTDSDGYPNCIENCDDAPSKQDPGDCGCAVPDTNSDGDSQADCNESCDSDPSKLAPGICGCGVADTDSDGDGTPNCNDLCPNNSPKTAPGVCGCAVPDTNTDGDAQPDCNETCDNDPNKLAPGTCGCGNGDAAGYVSCNGADGVCETAISTLSNCGSCGNACNLANAAEACTGSGHSYACTIASCDASHYKNCNSVTGDGCEIDTRTSTANCGACANNCASHSNVSSASCSASACSYTCNSGYGDCSATAGCETDTRTLSNCGACGVPCSRSNATATCATGACAISACTGGYSNCDGVDANGCEPLTTLANCGGCNTPCSVQNGTASCSTGTCAKVSCNSGYADCNGDLTCERDTNALGPCLPDTGCTTYVSGEATYFVCPTARTWADARSKCQLQTGGDLVHVNDATENEYVRTRISTSSWVGGTDAAVEAAWRWTDDNAQFWQGTSTGSAVNAAYTNWNTGEPNDGGSNEDCAELASAGGKWTDSSCTLTKPFVCEVHVDQCPSDPNKALPGQCGCGAVDTDTDSDGTADCNEACDSDPNKLAPGACGCGTADTDGDGDGTANCVDACPSDPNKIAAGACGCGVADTNTDGDAQADCNETCDSDANKVAPGLCGCGTPDTNTDGDAQPDCNETCDSDPLKLIPGTCGCGVADTDSDGDGTPNCNDLCPSNSPKTAPGLCGCAVPDTNTDGDAQPDCNETCDNDPNKTAPGACGCGNADTDSDGDGTANCNDACPNDPLKLVPGACGCGAADTNTDGDAQADCNESCDSDPNKLVPGVCGCGVADTNTDGDAQADCNETCDSDPNKTAPGVCGCGNAETDSDSDGTPNCVDLCPNDNPKTAPGLCGCAVADTNTDGDAQPDCNETCDSDPSKIAPGVCGCGTADTDSDGDGTANCVDACSSDPLKVASGVCGCGVIDPQASTGYFTQPVTLTNTSASATPDQQVKIDLPSTHPIFTEGYLASPAGNDIRVVNSDGVTPVPYWIETLTEGDATRKARIWVKASLPASGSRVVYLRTGNSSHASAPLSNIYDPTTPANGVMEFGDEFNGSSIDTARWTVVDATGWTVGGGALSLSNSSGRLASKVLVNTATQPVVVQVKFKATNVGTNGLMISGVRSSTSSGFGFLVHPTIPTYYHFDSGAWIGPGTYGGAYQTDWTRSGLRVAGGTDNRNAINRWYDDANLVTVLGTAAYNPTGAPVTLGARYEDFGGGQSVAAQWDFVAMRKFVAPAPTVTLGSAGGACGCGVADANTDGDTQLDCNETCDSDPLKLVPGTCGCGVSDSDTDGDMYVDCMEACDDDPLKQDPGQCGCGVADTDDDMSGIADCLESAQYFQTITVTPGCGNAATDSCISPAIFAAAALNTVTTACTAAGTLNGSAADADGEVLTASNGCGTFTGYLRRQANGQDVVVIPTGDFTHSSGFTLSFLGPYAVVLLVNGTVTATNTIQATTAGLTSSSSPLCAGAEGGNGGGSRADDGLGEGGGGGGGGHSAPGGSGGVGDNGGSAGAAGANNGPYLGLRGGCKGGDAGGVTGGRGGGALQISATGVINVATVQANGAAPTATSTVEQAGAGGGSGGTLILESMAGVPSCTSCTANGGVGRAGFSSNAAQQAASPATTTVQTDFVYSSCSGDCTVTHSSGGNAGSAGGSTLNGVGSSGTSGGSGTDSGAAVCNGDASCGGTANKQRGGGGGGGGGAGGKVSLTQAATEPDSCPSDPLKLEPGLCGCDVADTDSDNDGTADCLDACDYDAGTTSTPCSDYQFVPSNITISSTTATPTTADTWVRRTDLWAAPTVTCSSSPTINTDSYSAASTNLSFCGATVSVLVRTQVGGGQVVVIPLRGLTVNSGVTVRLTGQKPVIFMVDGNATINGTIDAGSNKNTTRGAGAATCTVGMGLGGTGGTADGGAGGGHGTAGGTGGLDSGSTGAATSSTTGSASLTPLRGGCAGGAGGVESSESGGAGGYGGGAVQVSASGVLSVSTTGTIKADGGGGKGGDAGFSAAAGGGGGGSGGAVLLEAGAVSSAGAVRANGGGGGAGGNSFLIGTTGGDGTDGGSGASANTNGGAGGAGSSSSAAAGTIGANASSTSGGGGGGGGGYGRLLLQPRVTGYYQSVTVTAGSATVVGHQVKLELGPTNVMWTRLRSSTGDDIRVTDTSDFGLPLWIELLDTVNQRAILWVRLPSALSASASTTLRLRYGGLGQNTSVSDISATMDFGDDFRSAAAISDTRWDAGDGTSAANATLFSVGGAAPNAYLATTNTGTPITGRLRSATGLDGPRILQSRATVVTPGGDGLFVAGVTSANTSITSNGAGIMSVQQDHIHWAGNWELPGYYDAGALDARYTVKLNGTNATYLRENLSAGVYTTAWERSTGPYPFTNAQATTNSFSNIPVVSGCSNSTSSTCVAPTVFTGGAVTLACGSPTTLSTDSYTAASTSFSLCGNTVTGYVRAQSGGPSVLVLPFNGNLNLTGTLKVTGGKPIVFLVMNGNATVTGTLDVSSIGQLGAGANVSCTTPGASGVHNSTSNAGNSGGAGGAFAGSGGSGGAGNNGAATVAGSAAEGNASLVPLRGGCKGGNGGVASGTATGGDSGGAVQISATGTVTVASGGAITAAGEPGLIGSTAEDGGGGGGSGGAVLLQGSSTPVISGSVSVVGGGGAGGQSTAGTGATSGSGSTRGNGADAGTFTGPDASCVAGACTGSHSDGGNGGNGGSNASGGSTPVNCGAAGCVSNGTTGGGGGGGGGSSGRTSYTSTALTYHQQHIALGHRYDNLATSTAVDLRWSWVLARKYVATEPTVTPSNVELP
jgi:Lectin C-type domain/Domain of unknown function (DUF2341)